MTVIKIERLHKPALNLSVTWAITYKCNLNCAYCNTAKNNIGEIDPLVVFDYLTFLKYHSDFDLEIYGGEPTIYHRLEDILNFTNSLGIPISIYSNMLKPIAYYASLLDTYKNLNIRSTLHGSLDKDMLSTIKNIPSDRITATLVLPDISYKDVIFVEKELSNYKVELNVIDDKLPKSLYSLIDAIHLKNKEDIIKFITDSGSSYSKSLAISRLSESTNYIGWKCFAGIQKQFITPDGYVYPCEAYSKHQKNDYLYNLESTEYKQPNAYSLEPLLCKCECSDCELYITKEM